MIRTQTQNYFNRKKEDKLLSFPKRYKMEGEINSAVNRADASFNPDTFIVHGK